jgi:hypothetical protein
MPSATTARSPIDNPPVIPSTTDPLAIPIHLARHRELLEHQHGQRALQTYELENIAGVRRKSGTDEEFREIRARNEVEEQEDAEGSENVTAADPLLSQEPQQMGKKKKSPNLESRSSTPDFKVNGQNGHATGAMERSILEHRRRHSVLDSPTSAAHAVHLMSRSSFSLDERPQLFPPDYQTSVKGFSDLPERDRRNFLLLVLLYFLQGVPMGLAGGSVPFLLKSYHVSYAQMGVFSLASYPYSLKLLWSPIVDAVWSPKVGRRKSWILPIQTISGIGMLWLAGRAEQMMKMAGKNDGTDVWTFTWWWFMLVFMCATQDIAVDGWALTLLSPENLSYASTAQTVGLTAGQFLSSTIFLAFNSKDFANRWFRTTPGDTGLITLGGALAASGWVYLIVTVGLAILKREDFATNDEGVWDVYKVMLGILKLKNIQTLLIVHLIAKIGFQTNDAVTGLKLLDKGFGQDNMALTVLIDFPFEIALGYYVGKWSSVYSPMQLWCWAFVGRLCAAACAQIVVYFFPAGGVTTGYLIIVIFAHVFSTFMNTVMFVAVSAFHAKIADPLYGGTYMTLLAT